MKIDSFASKTGLLSGSCPPRRVTTITPNDQLLSPTGSFHSERGSSRANSLHGPQDQK
jgi:hypothetical protein